MVKWHGRVWKWPDDSFEVKYTISTHSGNPTPRRLSIWSHEPVNVNRLQKLYLQQQKGCKQMSATWWMDKQIVAPPYDGMASWAIEGPKDHEFQ